MVPLVPAKSVRDFEVSAIRDVHYINFFCICFAVREKNTQKHFCFIKYLDCRFLKVKMFCFVLETLSKRTVCKLKL